MCASPSNSSRKPFSHVPYVERCNKTTPVGYRDSDAALVKPADELHKGLLEHTRVVLHVGAPEDAMECQILHQRYVCCNLQDTLACHSRANSQAWNCQPRQQAAAERSCIISAELPLHQSETCTRVLHSMHEHSAI